MIIWPVDEIGRNSVRPSMIARTIACRIDMDSYLAVRGAMQDGEKLNNKSCHSDDRSQGKSKEAKAMRFFIQCHDGET